MNAEGKARVEKHLHIAGGKRQHENRPPAGDGSRRAVRPAALPPISCTRGAIEADDMPCPLDSRRVERLSLALLESYNVPPVFWRGR